MKNIKENNSIALCTYRLLQCVLILFCTMTVNAQVKFVNFDSFDAMKKKAAKESKLIFVQINADICAQCEEMGEKTFSNSLLKEKYEANFISTKIKKNQGFFSSLKDTSLIKTMGGSFYFSSNGDLLLQYNSITNFPYKYLELADQVINRSDKINKLYSLEKEYKSTKTKTPEFIRKYINLSKEFDRNSDTAVEEYVSKLPIDSIYNKSIIRLVMEQGLPLNSRISQLIKNSNITLYDTIWKSLDNNKRVEINRKIISSTQSIAFRTKNENLAFQLSTFIRGTYGTDYKKGQFYSLKMLLSFYKLTNNSNKYFRISDNLIYDMMKVSNDTLKNWDKKEQQFSITSNSEIRRYSKVSCQYASELNSIAWNYYDMSTDLEDLAKALKWVKRALEINAEVCKPQNNDNSALLDTYAHLLYKMNQFDEAISWQKKAIEVRKNAGINSVSLENELEKMQKRSIKFL